MPQHSDQPGVFPSHSIQTGRIYLESFHATASKHWPIGIGLGLGLRLGFGSEGRLLDAKHKTSLKILYEKVQPNEPKRVYYLVKSQNTMAGQKKGTVPLLQHES